MTQAIDSTALASLSDLDSAQASIEHSRLINSKLYLRNIYEEHYRFFGEQTKNAPVGHKLELGSGGGFLREVMPGALTSDVVKLPTTAIVLSGTQLPFPQESLAAIMMINVLHHIQNVHDFFDEALRCLKPGGRILMIEPANTLWSRFIYKNFHHEPFVPEQKDWLLPQGGRMSSANDALPWIIFVRDRKLFSEKYPKLAVDIVEPYMPVRYLVSGGVSKPQLLPGWSYGFVKFCEDLVSPLNPLVGMFMRIAITKK